MASEAAGSIPAGRANNKWGGFDLHHAENCGKGYHLLLNY